MGRRQTVAWSGFRREQGRGSIPTLIPLYWLEGVPFREKTVGDFRIGAELHPGAIVDLEKPNLNLLVGRNGLASKDFMFELFCLGPLGVGLGTAEEFS
ncbi:hypothetical protein BLL38_28530 [Pseudomonas gessardii]|nr:hypothetical protein BLL38_28530 [Pseudomonas gessardii]